MEALEHVIIEAVAGSQGLGYSIFFSAAEQIPDNVITGLSVKMWGEVWMHRELKLKIEFNV